MRILIVSQYYKPVRAAATKRASRIAEYLSNKGHQVTVLTGTASYPTGILDPKYKGKLWCKEKDGKINIIRTYEFPTSNEGFLKRLVNYFSFSTSSSIATLFMPKYDLVIVTSPPFFTGLTGLTAKFWKGSKFIFDIRDLWPDSAIDLGMAKPTSLPAKILYALEKKYYKSASKIITATPSIKAHLVEEGWPSEKIEVLVNSVDTDAFSPRKIDREKYGFKKEDFIVCYTGNHSSAQDLVTAVEAGEYLKNEKNIKLLFVGEGETKLKMEELAKKLKLNNIIFWSLQDMDEVVNIINFSDVGLTSLANTPVLQEAFPTKSFEYFACGKPVIAAIGGLMKETIEKNEVGLVVKSGDAHDLARAILKLYQDKKLTEKMGQNARKLALDSFSNEKFYSTLDKIIN